ncbi:MAG: heavy metal translocating P-type ATPase [Betaproteobacteria bacterium]|nr:heavy metal translocating P-type ATPase [Betaproteobacteria bacterium]
MQGLEGIAGVARTGWSAGGGAASAALCPSPSSTAAAVGEGCFHCGAALPAQPASADIDGATRWFCCGGCAAAAQVIASGGLCAYYDKNSGSALPALPAETIERLREQWQALADPEFLRAFATELGGGAWRTMVAVEGIHCGACVWLIERHLQRIPGVRAAAVNYATRRVLLEWDDTRVHLGELLEALARIGYQPSPNVRHASEASQRRASRMALLRTLVAWLAMMQVMMLAWPGYSAGGQLTLAETAIFRWASLSITLPALLFSGWTFLDGSLRDLRMRRLGMDVPVVLGLWGAFLASAASVLRGSGPVYFDSVTMFLALVLSARLIESGLRHRSANAADELLQQLPAAVRRRDDCGAWQTVAITRLRRGDVVQVPSGSLVPVDGEVLDGESHADEALLTGESRAVPKRAGEQVLAGSMNLDSPLVVRAAAAGQGTRIAQMVELLNGALAHKPRAAALADHAARWFTIGLLAVAAATAGYWALVDPSRMLPAVIAVLVVSCPCALSLAIPAALAAATARLSRAGVLVARGHALDAVARVRTWVFDKTGTLTLGHGQEVEVQADHADTAAHACGIAAALEQGVQHPLARALLEHARDTRAELPQASQVQGVRVLAGRGIIGRVEARWYALGRAPLVAPGGGSADAVQLEMRELSPAAGAAEPASPWDGGDTGRLLARIAVRERLRPGACEALRSLAEGGATLTLLSGDKPDSVGAWAARVGIADAHAGLLPQDKLQRVRELQQAGRQVAMVGDGVNDAPTLGAADVSVSFADAAPIARAGADVVLVRDDMRALPLLVDVARRTQRVMRQNLAWALLYNAVFVPLAAAGRISPLWAAVGMSVSSLLVVLNSARLAWRASGEGAWTHR